MRPAFFITPRMPADFPKKPIAPGLFPVNCVPFRYYESLPVRNTQATETTLRHYKQLLMKGSLVPEIPQHPQTRRTAPPATNPPVSVLGSIKASKEAKLTSFMVTNIAVIAVVGIISILLMLFGVFEGKVPRIISTLMLFAAFIGFIYYDTKEKHPSWYMTIAQSSSVYMLGLSLVFIWGTLNINSFNENVIIFGTAGILILTKLGAVVVQKISEYIFVDQSQLSFTAFISAAAMGITTVLFTLPIGLNAFADFEEPYWKGTVAVVLFAGLSLSIMALLVWFFKSKAEDDNLESESYNALLVSADAKRDETIQSKLKRQAQERAGNNGTNANTAPEMKPDQTFVDRDAPLLAKRPESVNPVQSDAPQFAPPVRAALAWPVFPNGYPLPAKENGRPDFEALQYTVASYVKAERQWFN